MKDRSASLFRLILGVIILSVLTSGGVLGETKPQESESRGSDLVEALLWGEPWLVRDVTDAEHLTLEDCIRLSLVYNLDVQTQRDSLRSTRQDLRSAENHFSLKGNLSAEHEQDVHTPVMELGSTVVYDPVLQQNVTTAAKTDIIDDDITTLSAPLTLPLKTGTLITGQPFLRESDYQKNQWSSGLSAKITQPLLDGFGYDVTTAELQKTRLALRQSENALENTVRFLTVGVIQDYYNLLKTQMIQKEQESALERSQEQLRAAKIRREEGEVAQLDVLRAELQVARNEDALIATRNRLESQWISFRLRLGLPMGAKVGIANTEVEFKPAQLDYEQLVDFALKNRLDLVNQEFTLEQARISLLKAKNQKLPNLDLWASYWFIDGNDDFERVYDFDQGSISVGATFGMPFGDVSDDVRYRKAELSLHQSETSLEDLRRQITSEVDNAVRQIQTLESRLELLKKNVEIAEEGFRLSRLSYEVGGLISPFELAQAQDDLTAARTDYVSALIDYKIALAQLDLRRGLDLLTLIETHTGKPLR